MRKQHRKHMFKLMGKKRIKFYAQKFPYLDLYILAASPRDISNEGMHVQCNKYANS